MIKSSAENYIKENFADNKLDVSKLKELNSEIAKRVIIEFVKICDSEISL